MPSRPKNFAEILSAAEDLIRVGQNHKGSDEEWLEKYQPVWDEKLQRLVSLIFENKQLEPYLSPNDVREKFWTLPIYANKSLSEITKDDLRAILDQLVGAPHVLNFYFPQKELVGFPDGYEVGASTLHTFDKLPAPVQSMISSDWKFRYNEEKELYSIRDMKEYEEVKRGETYFCLTVSASGREKAVEVASIKANQSFNILKCIYWFSGLPKLTECYWKADKNSGSIPHYRYKSGWARYRNIPELEKYVATLTRLIREKASDEIAKRCLTAIDLYCMVNRETPLQVQFLLSMIAVEGLLLGSDDKDVLGWKLRDKVALLIGDTPAWIRTFLGKKGPLTDEESDRNRVAARSELAKRVATLYNKRSGFVHPGEEDNSVTEADFGLASMIFRLSLQRLLWLREQKNIVRIHKEKTLDDHSLDFFIETLKYSSELGPTELD